MLLFGAGRGDVFRRFLVDGNYGQDAAFGKLAQSLSALYPQGSTEKHWLDGSIAKKGVGIMKIKSICVDNFKSLVDFRIDLADFNCLIGLNGCGKSTFLQFISFLTQLMRGKVDVWLDKHKLNKVQIPFFKDNRDSKIKFRIEFVSRNNQSSSDYWEGTFDTDCLYCQSETVQINETKFIAENIPEERNKKYYSIQENEKEPMRKNINFTYQGSIFSQLADSDLAEFDEFKNAIKSIQTFGLLTPFFLKQNAKNSHGSIGFEGENLSAFLHGIDEIKHVSITQKLKQVYPYFGDFKTRVLNDQTKELSISENYYNGNRTYTTQARSVNDGLLRIIAFLAELESKHQILLFDEIENGINSELIGFLLKELTESEKQIIVTTHSPMILNYLDDRIALPGVHYFYKNSWGQTQTKPFFDIPSMRKKLEVMGPGEAYIDTNLTELSEELSEQSCNNGKEDA